MLSVTDIFLPDKLNIDLNSNINIDLHNLNNYYRVIIIRIIFDAKQREK